MSTDASTLLEQLQRNLDRWGADLADWPDVERQQAVALCSRSAQAEALLMRQVEFQRRLDREFPVPELDLESFDQTLVSRLTQSGSQSSVRRSPHVPVALSTTLAWALNRIHEMAEFSRPVLAAGLLWVAGFSLGFSLGLSEPPLLANMLGDESETLAAVVQQTLADNSTALYPSYDQVFMQKDLPTQPQETE